MGEAFNWLGWLAESVLSLVPRIVIVRATHGGVKWRRGKHVMLMEPGLHIYWPIVTDYCVIVTARQTLNLVTQVLTTRDSRKIAVGVVVVYRIADVVLAIGKVNWDVDTTISDIAQAAVVSVIASREYNELLEMLGSGQLGELLTRATKAELRKYGVSVRQCKPTDFAECRVYKLLLDNNQ